MIFSWYKTMMLAAESNDVIGLRLMKIAGGGADATREVGLMLSEKIDAAVEAGMSLIWGGTTAAVVDRYREHVAANAARLSAEARPGGADAARADVNGR